MPASTVCTGPVAPEPSRPAPGMRVRIHRGAREIGGSCVEVASGDSRIVLDVGKPLAAGWDEAVPLPAVPGLADGGDPGLAGVVISHPHLDHVGLIGQVHPSVPVVIGREAQRLLAEAELFSPAGMTLAPAAHLADRTPVRLGAFTVTPYLADHSGYDAYSLLVEAGGRRLFYTGDLRGHGRKAHLFERLVAEPPPGIDVLLCEGTHVRTPGSGDGHHGPARTEADVERSLAERMAATDGAVAVVSSAQNIDRLVTVYRACRRAGRTLVCDLYGASVAAAIGRPTLPQPGFPGYRVYVPNRQRVLIKRTGAFDRIDRVRPCRVYPAWLAEHADRITLLQPSSALDELVAADVLAGGTVVWSLWPGYLREERTSRQLRRLEDAGVPLVVDHASGHATVEDLQRLAAALDPGAVVPIHTEGADAYGRLFDRVVPRADGEWWAA
jgi:ribonuclease J